jgi:signal peptidase I
MKNKKKLYGIILLLLLLEGCTSKIMTYLVPSESMKNTICFRERIVYKENEEIKNKIYRGEVIIYKEEGKLFISRVIALGKDTIKIENDKVFINGKEKKEAYCFYDKGFLKKYKMEEFIRNYPEEKIKDDEVFVMCDNRYNSLDSRYKGAISRKKIIGKALYISDENDPYILKRKIK